MMIRTHISAKWKQFMIDENAIVKKQSQRVLNAVIPKIWNISSEKVNQESWIFSFSLTTPSFLSRRHSKISLRQRHQNSFTNYVSLFSWVRNPVFDIDFVNTFHVAPYSIAISRNCRSKDLKLSLLWILNLTFSLFFQWAENNAMISFIKSWNKVDRNFIRKKIVQWVL